MDSLFGKLAFFFLAGAAIAGLVSGNWWPLIVAIISLFILAKVFMAISGT